MCFGFCLSKLWFVGDEDVSATSLWRVSLDLGYEPDHRIQAYTVLFSHSLQTPPRYKQNPIRTRVGVDSAPSHLNGGDYVGHSVPLKLGGLVKEQTARNQSMLVRSLTSSLKVNERDQNSAIFNSNYFFFNKCLFFLNGVKNQTEM